MATDKRARKKEHRDAVVAQRQALLRRRRAARLGAVLTVIALIVGAALITAGGDDDKGGGNEAGSQPEPTAAPVESTEPTEAPAGGVACGGEAPPPPSSKQYEAAEQVLEDGVDYRAVIETSCGTIEMDLLEEEAPVTVNNFVFLAQEGFYEGVTFHRVEPTFVIQGGDPQGTGAGGPGYEFEDELWAPSKKYVYGTVAMANAGPNTNGSQFFVIVHEPRKQQAGLAPAYTVFGEVTPASYETLEKIKKVETNGSTPVTPVYMESVEIVEA